MKKILIALAWLLSAIPLKAQVNEKPFIIPEVTQWQGEKGKLVLSGRVLSKGKAADEVARRLVSDAQAMHLKLTLAKGKAQAGDIVLQIQADKTLGNEGYRMDIGQTVALKAATGQGLFWGTRSILQMAEQGALPKGKITDIPQYALRGFMIDCGRKYIPMDYLHKLVKVLAYYKMNTLQVHLNDNAFVQFFNNDWMQTPAAFRLESSTYPGLTAKDGSYSKQEFIDFQKMAEANCVDIIPEIDVPAHSLAFTQYRPELASREYGMDHLDLFNPKTYEFVDGLFKEYLEGDNPVFRGRRVNVGTDEYSNANKEVVEKFRYFTDHCLELVQRYGKQPMLWGALSHAAGDYPVRSKGVIMNVWHNSFSQPKDMKQQGYELVSIPDGDVYIVPAAGYYQDYLNCERLYNNWTPAHIGNVQFEEQDKSLRGGMFAVWNDHYGNGITVKDIHHRFYPAMQTMATKCWTGQKTTLPYEIFERKRMILSEAPGVNELARIPSGVEKADLKTNQTLGLPIAEAGYDYEVSFDIDCREEAKGTVAFTGSNATFYLSDPKNGKIGFAREGYTNTFNYQLPRKGKVSLKIVGTNKETKLFVNGRQVDALGAMAVYPFSTSEKLDRLDDSLMQVSVYRPKYTMYYQQTLVFPLEKTGNYNSTISNLQVRQL